MKRTFERGDLLYGVRDVAVYKALIDYAIKSEVPVYEGTKTPDKSLVQTYPSISFIGDELTGSKSPKNSPDRNFITLSDFFEYCDNWKEARPVEVELNSKFVAKVDPCKVIILGQTVTHEAIEKLYEAVKSYNK